jgi:tetratricopeptide (TPR) repeat protein
MDEEALIRRTAVDHINFSDPKRQTTLLTSMLYDPVKAVRVEAARRIAEMSNPPLDKDQKMVFQSSLDDYIKSMEYSADFAFGRYNLANLYVAQNELQKAIENYRAAFKIDNLFYPAKVNLAMLYNRQGKNDEAEGLLREVVDAHSEIHEIHYSLGLLLAERKKYPEAATYLAMAAVGMPNRARVHYNLGLLLQHLKKASAAESSLIKALELEPDNLEYLFALADFYLKRGKLQKAKRIAEKMIVQHPTQRIGQDILNLIEKNLSSGTEH